jgi:hypothetical protein
MQTRHPSADPRAAAFKDKDLFPPIKQHVQFSIADSSNFAGSRVLRRPRLRYARLIEVHPGARAARHLRLVRSLISRPR